MMEYVTRKFLPLLGCLALLACSEAADEAARAADNDESARPLPDGITLVERVEARDDGIIIPYTKYRLDNGLTLIVHEDSSDPLIHVDVTYHVGSAREEPRRSGFAHFFEHMMFQGSEHVEDEEHFRIVTAAGGDMNGTTNQDRTNYFETVPSNQLESMFWLESDRMGFLLPAVTQEKFEVQRSTVKNEREQNVENQPYGRFTEVNNAALYPPAHPYSWPVIGYPEDLDAATLEDLKHFFLRWYGPNNATVSVGGNVDEREVVDLAIQYFGEIPRGPEVTPENVEPVNLEQDRYVSYVDPNIRFPALLFTFPTVPLDHPDKVALDALNNIMGMGRKSFFYKEFVLTREAIQASAFHNSQELAGSLTFFVLPYPGTPLSEFEQRMRGVFENFNEDSITEEDIQIFKSQREAGLVNRLASVRGKVSELAYNETFLNDPNNIQQELEAIRSLTKEDVLRVFDTYIRGRNAVIQSVVPEDTEGLRARPDNYEIPQRPPRQPGDDRSLEERAVMSSFDRSVQPGAGPVPLVDMPSYWEQDIEGGIEMIGITQTEVPLVNLRLVFEGGHLLESPEHYGLASLTAAMMNEGTSRYSAEEFERELQKIGSRISVNGGDETLSISVQSLRRNMNRTLDLLAQRLYEYEFTQEDLERLRQQQIESIEASREQPSTIAENVYQKIVYGGEHTLAVPPVGRVETLRQITLEDVEAFARRSLVSRALKVTVVGEVPREEVVAGLDFLRELPDEDVAIPEQPEPPVREENTLYLVDKPGAPQSEIRIGYMADLAYDPTGEYFERFLMNYPLGGAFNSRINLNLREEKGYTYGARSRFSAGRLPGPFTASASVRTETTADAIVQFMNEMTEYRSQGITEEELQFTKNAVGQSEALDYETPGQKTRLLEEVITYDLSNNFVEQQQRIIDNLTRVQVNQLAREHLPVNRMAIVVVGDKSAILPSLQALDYEIVELDTRGNPVNPESPSG